MENFRFLYETFVPETNYTDNQWITFQFWMKLFAYGTHSVRFWYSFFQQILGKVFFFKLLGNRYIYGAEDGQISDLSAG